MDERPRATTRDLTEAMVRVVALVALVSSTGYAIAVFHELGALLASDFESDGSTLPVQAAGFLLMLVLSVALWFGAPWCARTAVRAEREAVIGLSLGRDDLLRAVMVGAGILVVFFSLLQFAVTSTQMALMAWRDAEHAIGPSGLSSYFPLDALLYTIVQCVFGVLIIMGSRSVLAIANRLRGIGLGETPGGRSFGEG